MPDAGGHSKDTVSMLVQSISERADELGPELNETIDVRLAAVLERAWMQATREILTPLIEEAERTDDEKYPQQFVTEAELEGVIEATKRGPFDHKKQEPVDGPPIDLEATRFFGEVPDA